EIEMRIAQRMNELAGLEPADMRDHVGEERIGGDVERNADEDVGGSLIELTRELAVADIELEQAMARRQGHAVDIGRVPRRHDEAARIRVLADAGDDIGDLVDG